MDPSMTLELMRAAIRNMNADRKRAAEAEDEGDQSNATTYNELADDEAREAADYAAALDGWLSKGGFLPDAWKAGR